MRYYPHKKNTTEDYSKTLNIFDFKKFRMLKKGQYTQAYTWSWSKNGQPNGNIGLILNIKDLQGTVRVYFTQTDKDTGEVKNFDYVIQLSTTSCHI